MHRICFFSFIAILISLNTFDVTAYLKAVNFYPHRSTGLFSKAKKEKVLVPSSPEFSRIINAAQIPQKRPVLCKLLANENERRKLAQRFDMSEITYFAVNMTVSRRDPETILIDGELEAHVKAGELLDADVIKSEFDTILLDNTNGAGISIEDATDYDEEVGPNGEIDVGEIASQYLSLEIF
jgi:hypothetical protein